MPDSTTTITALPNAHAIGFVVLGIFTSILLPVAVRTLKKAESSLESAGQPSPTFWERLKAAVALYLGKGATAAKYILAAVFVACVIVFLLGLQFYKVRDALLAGFAWESFVNKLYQSAGKGGN